VAGPDGYGPPIADDRHGIGLNGDAATGQTGDPLVLPAPHRN